MGRWLAIITAGLLLLAGCGGVLTTDIGDILADSRGYDGRTVTIKGKVEESMNILVLKAFSLNDGTGSILVVTDRGVPSKGKKVRVKGVVNRAFSIGSQSVVVLQEGAR